MGWAYAEVLPMLPPRPWTAGALGVLIVVSQLPATVLAELRRPMFTLTPAGVVFQMTVDTAVVTFIAELLLTATIVGWLGGWWRGRSRRAAAAMALAGFTFALGPGHNIPFIGGTGGVGREGAIMGSVIVVSALVLVEGHARLSQKGSLHATKGH